MADKWRTLVDRKDRADVMTSISGLADVDPAAVTEAIAAGESLTVEFKREQRE